MYDHIPVFYLMFFSGGLMLNLGEHQFEKAKKWPL